MQACIAYIYLIGNKMAELNGSFTKRGQTRWSLLKIAIIFALSALFMFIIFLSFPELNE